MKQIQIFPFSRDGYHYDVQPGYLPVFEVDMSSPETPFLFSPPEFGGGGLGSLGSTVEDCVTNMQNHIHEVYTSVRLCDEHLGVLNEEGMELLGFYNSRLKITEQ